MKHTFQRSVYTGPAAALVVLALWPWTGAAIGQTPPDIETASTPRIDVRYASSAAPRDLESVELWATDDGGQTWTFAGYDDDRRSPITFTAPHEGDYGFYVILSNAAGASGPRPSPGTPPQHQVLIDYSVPVLQLHQAEQVTTGDGFRRIAISWSAYDAHFTDRPIEIDYRPAGESQWIEIDRQVSNVGHFEWLPPSELSGEMELRVLARDAAHHVTIRLFAPIHLDAAPSAPPMETTAPVQPPEPTEYQLASMTAPPPIDPAVDAATALVERGVWNLQRGRLEVAAERFREALGMSPQHREARLNLAGVRMRQKAYTDAEREYETLLQSLPNDRDGLRGLSLALAAQHRYSDAVAALRRIADEESMDPQTLIELGDLYYLGGNAPAAIREWRRAERKPDLSTEQVRAIRARLELRTPAR